MGIKNFTGYTLGEYLGGGLYTKIYKAYSFLPNPIYGSPVAIKILYLKGNILEKNKLIKQFEREAKIAMNLDHPNIVKVYNFGRFENNYAMIMEYIDGKNLKEYLYEIEKWDLNKILTICYEIGKGLEYIHQNDIVHKDIKPDNILISFDFKTIKITDFGIAKLPKKIWRKDIFPKSGTVTKFGIISYIAPEQLEGNATFQSDIYSFGVTMDEIITAKLFLEGKENEDYFKRIDMRAFRKNTGRQKFLSEDLPIPSNLKEIIKKATEENINLRYQNMTTLLNDLKEFLPK